MYIVAYDTTGMIFKFMQGPSLEEAAAFIAEDYGDGYLFLEADHEVDNSRERVDVTVDPHVVVPFTPSKTPDEIKAEILAATQQRLDEFARTRNYDSIMSAATYAASTVEQFATEGQRAVELRDQTWAMLYQMLAEVQGGMRPMPSGYDEIEPVLPKLLWPEQVTV